MSDIIIVILTLHVLYIVQPVLSVLVKIDAPNVIIMEEFTEITLGIVNNHCGTKLNMLPLLDIHPSKGDNLVPAVLRQCNANHVDDLSEER